MVARRNLREVALGRGFKGEEGFGILASQAVYTGAERERERCRSLQSPLVCHPRVQLAQMAPLGLRGLQVYRECLVREEPLALLGPRETE